MGIGEMALFNFDLRHKDVLHGGENLKSPLMTLTC